MYKYIVHDTLLDEIDEFDYARDVADYCNYSRPTLAHYFSVSAEDIVFEGRVAQIFFIDQGRYTIIRYKNKKN